MNNADLEIRLDPQQNQLEFIHFIWRRLVEAVDSEYSCWLFFRHIDSDDYPDDDTAFVDFDGEKFEVYIDKRLQTGTVVDYLIHELAHVGTWFVNEEDDHGPMFGVEYARLYRRYLELYGEFWNDHN